MNYNKFNFSDSSVTITHIKKEYSRTDSGKNWKSTPDTINNEIVNNEFYNNYVKSIPFFNGFMGGSCRAAHSYTAAGYLPTVITTISPDKKQKIIDTFSFKYE